MRHRTLAALVLGWCWVLAAAGTAAAAFQVITLSVTSGEPGATVTMRVDASHLIGGLEQSRLFLIPQQAQEDSPGPARCDEVPGASSVGELQWHASPVEFQGNTYQGFVGEGSFTVAPVEDGIYVLAVVEDDVYTGCHVFTLFGVGMELPDTAMQSQAPSGGLLTLVGLTLLLASRYRWAANRFARSIE